MHGARLRLTGIVALGLFAVTNVSFAAPPRGIDGPLTITESGAYVVTQDIVVATPPAIVIAAPNVVIDLNGKSVSTTGVDNGNVVVLRPGARQLRIFGGTIAGGSLCLTSSVPGIRLSMDRVRCTGAVRGIHINASNALITNSEFSTARKAIHIGGRFPLRFEGNTVFTTDYYSAGLSFLGMTSGLIARNTIGCTSFEGSLLALDGIGFVRVVNNTLSAGNAQSGVSLSGGVYSVTNNTITGSRNSAIAILSSGNHVVGNRISHAGGSCAGITVAGSDNVVSGNSILDYTVGLDVLGSGNIVSGNTVLESWERGILVNGSANSLVANEARSRYGALTTGLEFSATSAGNVYKSNLLLGNPGGGLLDSGVDNVDAGGNVQDAAASGDGIAAELP